MNRKVNILNVWASDFDDVRCNAILYQNNRQVANIIASYDLTEYSDDNLRVMLEKLILKDFDKYLSLPKVSRCSCLLKEIYDDVCSSDSTMCHITIEDWNESYKDRYTEKDFNILKEEVMKYKLDDVITFGEYEYKIVAYGDLETSFNDDRKLKKEREVER